MKSEGLVQDRWELFAPSIMPSLKCHLFLITKKGRQHLKSLHATEGQSEPYPFGYRILLYLSHGGSVTTTVLSRLTNQLRGQVSRVLKSMCRAGLVNCYIDKSAYQCGYQPMTHHWTITELGQKSLLDGPKSYNHLIHERRARVRDLKK
jgi:hypothetical protein